MCVLVQPCLIFLQCWGAVSVVLAPLICAASTYFLVGCQWRLCGLLCLQPSSLLGWVSFFPVSTADTALEGPPSIYFTQPSLLVGHVRKWGAWPRNVIVIESISGEVKSSVHPDMRVVTLSLPAMANECDLEYTRGGQRESD